MTERESHPLEGPIYQSFPCMNVMADCSTLVLEDVPQPDLYQF